MIWSAGRHAVVVPEPFSSASSRAVNPEPAAPAEADWGSQSDAPVLERGPRRLATAVDLREVMRRAS